MLSVNINQLFRNVLQLTDGCQASIDPCAALALHINNAAQHKRFVCLKPGCFKPSEQFRLVVKFDTDLAALGTLADNARITARSQSKL